MDDLAGLRPVFHSEADFQHALAMQLARELPAADIRLEYRPLPGQSVYTDIWLTLDGVHCAIELKYKTKRATIGIAGERFELADQGAQDTGKYDFWKDVERVEKVRSYREGTTGAVIFLTNDQNYWNEPSREGTCAEAFHMHEGRTATGELPWAGHTGAGTMRGRESPVQLGNKHRVAWRDYGSTQEGVPRFRYALVEVAARAEV
ncbi:MAG: hypothetical protein M1617_00545 [Actinobacteria bacterium]|nr:hypothetical protein [Actinomycetota bacterium]